MSYEQGSYEIAEGASSTIKVVLSADPERDVNIPITVIAQGGASSTDYTVSNESVEFQPGATSSTFTFEVSQDSVDDDGESVLLGFRDLPPGVTTGTYDTTTVTIIDDDDPIVSVSYEKDSYEVAEGSRVTVKVTLSADPERTVLIPITTTNRGGAFNTDYSIFRNSAEFQPGDTSRTLTFLAVQDFFNDDDESVLLGFRDLPDGVTEGTHTTTTVTIIDDDDGDPAFNVGKLGAFWARTDAESGNLLIGTCSGLETFRIIWGAREDLRGADEWDAHVTKYGGMSLVSHSFRESPGFASGHYEMNGTARMEGEGHLSNPCARVVRQRWLGRVVASRWAVLSGEPGIG